MVGAGASSENVADIGSKRLSLPTMKCLMHNLGAYDSETCSLVGQDECDMKVSKQNLRLITSSSKFKVSANLIRLIVASSLASSDALSCGTAVSAMDMAWIDWSEMDGVIVDFVKFPFMQMYYFIQLLFMQLSYITELFYPYFHGLAVVVAPYSDVVSTWINGLAYLVGWSCIAVFIICLACRLNYGPDAIDRTPGRVFVLLGEVIQCMGHHVLEWYGERKIKEWEKECQKSFEAKDKQGIRYAQNRMISWRDYLRMLQGIVHNFFDEEEPGESGDQRLQRYQNCSLSECSDPEFWQSVHHIRDDDDDDDDDDHDDESSYDSLAYEDWLANYTNSRNSALGRAPRGLEHAEVHSNNDMICHHENIIDTLSTSRWRM